MSRHPVSATDAELLQRFEQVRDQDAFAELVRRHGPMVVTTARRVLKRTEDVDEAFQATMFALAKAAGRLQRMPDVGGWLHKVAYTCAAEHRRMTARWVRKRERAMERRADVRTEGDSTDDPAISIVHEELESIVDEELLRLPAKLREVIVLCDLEGLPQRGVAKKLSVPTSTVHDRLMKGRKQLHSRLVSRGATLTVAGVALPALSGRVSAAIAQETIDDITARATLFASGKTSQIGVSSTVIELAHTPLAISKLKAVVTLLAACVIIAGGGGLLLTIVMERTTFGSAPGTAIGTVFVDDFVDGNIKDDDPVSWIPAFERGSLEIAEESLILTGRDSTFALTSSRDTNTALGDTSIRTQLRLLQGNNIGIGVRYDDTLGLSYGCSLFADRVAVGVGGERYETFAETSVDFNVTTEDVVLQVDVIGDTIKLWAWTAGSSKPPKPTLTARNRSLADGEIFLFVSGRTAPGAQFPFLPGAAVKGAFRFVHVATTPIQDAPTEGVTK